MPAPRHNANGHRRRELRARVLAESTHCALCDRELDKSAGMITGAHGPKCQGAPCAGCIPHPRRVEVDEDIPRSRGGSPLERMNTNALCRECNQFKGAQTLAEARVRYQAERASQTVQASPFW